MVVVGGSCGAEKINDSMLGLLHDREIPFQILWATGEKYFDDVADRMHRTARTDSGNDGNKDIRGIADKEGKVIREKGGRVRIVDYIVHMNEILSVADLIVCRAGSMTVGEIREFRVPAILIPFAQAAGNHQYFNALELEKAGCAVIRKEAELSGESLYDEICGLLSDQERLKRMRSGYDKISISNSNQKIFESIRKEMGPPAEAAERRSQC